MPRRSLSPALFLLCGMACSDPTGPQLASVAITPPAHVLVVGDTIRLTATGLSSAGDTIRDLVVVWASSDTAVATVSATGLVTGRGVGSATVTAASGAIGGPAGISVTIHFASVAPGAQHDCALTAAGAAYCWGENYAGQLGDGGTTARTLPTAVVGGHQFVRLASGGSFSCGIAVDSLAWCWGSNFGTLGIGSRDEAAHPVPVAVSGGHRFRDLSASHPGVCGVTTQAEAFCWGRNWFGVLGADAPPDSIISTPSLVVGGLAFKAIRTAESHTCGVTVAGAAHCWGANSQGELGAVTDTVFPAPVLVLDTLSLVGLTAGGDQLCGLDAGATVCWGTMEIGEGYWHRRSPQRAALGLTFTQVSTAYSTSCGLDAAGAAWCWGSNWFGELGDGTREARYPPVPVAGGHAFASLDVGDGFVCGLEASGAAHCWGYNGWGQLGNGSSGGSDSVPVAVAGGHAFRSIVAGGDHTCGIDTDSTAWCWGQNFDGQLGDSSNTHRSQPVPVRGGLKFIALTVGGSIYPARSCGITAAGAAYCWGSGSGGQLGTGSTASSTIPVPVAGGFSFTRVATAEVGPGFTCGVAGGGAGAVYCWGSNRFGQLGRGDTISSSIPVAVTGGLSVTDLDVGSSFACAHTVSAGVYCWGSNYAGQMGLGFLGIESLRPVPVQRGLSFAHIGVGVSHSCGLAADSTAWCWGRNWEGQLGVGDSVSSMAPRGVAGGLHFASLTLGYVTSCGLTALGAAYCWGGGRPAAPSPAQPGTVFLTLTSGPGDRVCGVRADSTVVCMYASPYAAPSRRTLPFQSDPLRSPRRARRSK